MKLIAFILVILSSMICKTNAQENYDLYLLFGQSNMVGLAPIEKQDRYSNQKILMLSYDNCSGQTVNTWAVEGPPMHCSDWHAGLGLGDWFAKDMADFDTTKTIGIIPCGIGGVDIDFFRKGVISARRSQFTIPPDNHWEGAYPWMLERCREAMKSGTIKGILLHQGESDNGNGEWKNKVIEIISDLKTDLNIGDVPILIGELGYYFGGGVHNPIIASTAAAIPNAYVISADGLTSLDDNLHFNSQSVRTLGHRYASRLKELQTGIVVDFINNVNDTIIASDDTQKKFTVMASCQDVADTIEKVEFLDNGTLVYVDEEIPYEWNASLSASFHRIKARATSKNGKSSITGIINKLSNSGISVTGITLSTAGITLETNVKQQLSYTILPYDAENKTVSWRSGTPGIATVSPSGLITAVSVGTANITVTTSDGAKTAKCTVIVVPSGTSQKYEAEKAVLTGCTIGNIGKSGYSGDGFVEGLDAIGDEIKFNVNVPSDGKYVLTIRYQNSCEICQKMQFISVNGISLAKADFNARVNGWLDLSYGYITLNSGGNTIEILSDYGWTFIDYITISAGSIANVGINKMLNLTKVFPNPVNSGVDLIISADTNQASRITLIDSFGRVVFNKILVPENGMIVIKNTSEYKGIYILNFVSPNLNQTQKIVFN